MYHISKDQLFILGYLHVPKNLALKERDIPIKAFMPKREKTEYMSQLWGLQREGTIYRCLHVF